MVCVSPLWSCALVVERWRFINAGIANYLNLALEEHSLHLIALDSCPRSQAKIYSDKPAECLILGPGKSG